MKVHDLLPYLHCFTEIYLDWKENGKTAYHGNIQRVPKYLLDRDIWDISAWSCSSIIIRIY